jgi:hypothetical protein
VGDTHVVTREALRAEAHLLRDLIDQNQKDLKAIRDGARFVYFVDAHELKAFISANDHEKLTGFIFSVEGALENQRVASDVEALVRLKAEQTQRRLLFEQPHPLLLLPSHAEEMDEEVAFVSLTTLPQDYDLASIARRQWALLTSDGVTRDALAKLAVSAADGNDKSKRKLLNFLTAQVPTLVQLLFPAPRTPKARLDALLSHSRLSLLANADWNSLGFSEEQSASLDACTPSADDIALWTRQLIANRRNTLQANRRDASALAYLTALNRQFAKMGVNARACLVTRAVTLLRTMRIMKAAGNLDAQDCLRHSRLVVTVAENPEEHAPISGGTLDPLLFALETYERRLSLPPGSDALAPETEAKELLSAWNAFEEARLTIELAQETPEKRGTEKVIEDTQWQDLVAWLQSDRDVIHIVEQRLQKQVAHFKSAIVARDAVGVDQAPVWVFTPAGNTSRCVQAIEVNGLGPFDLPKRFFDDSGSFRYTAEPAADDVSEEFFVLAFLQGCLRHWTLAQFYGRLALQSAQMRGRQHIRHDARLLVAQLLRISGGVQTHEAEAAEKADHFAQAADMLVSRTGRRLEDPRFEVEWWSLQLERLLDVRTSGSGTGPELAAGIKALSVVVRSEAPQVSVRSKECLVAFALAGLPKWKATGKPMAAEFGEIRHLVRKCHADLTNELDTWRREREVDELPQFTRAIEILGYDLIRRLGTAVGDPPEGELHVPAPLMFDVVSLQAQLTRHDDEVSKLVATELVRLIDRTRGRRQFQVVHAPIVDRLEVLATINRLPEPSARDAAMRASEIVHTVGNSQGFLVGNEGERELLLQGIRLFDQALSASEVPRGVQYHCKVELGYLKLLSALAHKSEDRKRAALEEVSRVYESLIEEYPDSSVLRYRQSFVLEELGLDEASFDSINEAMRLVSTDSRISPEHWFRSVIRRRLALRFSNKATEMRDRIRGDDVARKHYLDLMAKAYQLVGEPGAVARTGVTYIDRLETRRRLNNQVYYAALFGSSGGDIAALPGLTEEKLMSLTKQLIPDGDIEDVHEVNIAHTIGLAFSTLKQPQLAAEAAKRVVDLVAASGDNAESDSTRQVLNDALSWIGAVDRDTVPGPLR